MRPLCSSVLLVFISHVYALPKFGFLSKKPPVYRPTYCITPPFNPNCKPLTPLWYYEPKLKTCVPISAGYHVEGVNRFVSLKKCSEMCQSRSKIILKQCLTPPTITAGGILQYAWYFDEFTKSCKMFTFSACNNSNGNYFASEMKCQSVCLPKMKPTPLCSADPISDMCLIQRKHYFFSFRNNTCMQFPKKGCGKGSNSFATMTRCIDTCSYNQSSMGCPNCAQKHPNELPSMGKPTGPIIAGPVSPPVQLGPSMPLSPPITQGTPGPTMPPAKPVQPNAPVSQGKPGSTVPASPVLPIPPMQSGQPVPAVKPAPPSAPIQQGNTIPTLPPGNSVPPFASTQSSKPTPTGQPLLPSAPSLSGNTNTAGPNVAAFPPTTPTKPGQTSQLSFGSPTPPVSATGTNKPKTAALPLRAGFHRK